MRARNPRATVFVIENGLPDEAFRPREKARDNILYLGRLEIAQKGLDILLQAFACISDTTSSVAVKIQVNLQSAAGQTVHEVQYIHVTSQGEICYATFSTDRPAAYFPLFAHIAATIQVG